MGVEDRGQAARAPSTVGSGVPWVMALLWMAAIFWLSSQPDSALPEFWRFAYHDTVEHLAFYVVLGLLLWWGFRTSVRTADGAARWAVLAGGLFAASDEIHQRFVPTRRCEWTDWGADVVGVMLGSAVAWLVWRSLASRRKGAENGIER